MRYYNRAYMLNPWAGSRDFTTKPTWCRLASTFPFQDLLFFVEKLTAEGGNFHPRHHRGKASGLWGPCHRGADLL